MLSFSTWLPSNFELVHEIEITRQFAFSPKAAMSHTFSFRLRSTDGPWSTLDHDLGYTYLSRLIADSFFAPKRR
jgi:hypothetical protein